MKTLVQITAQMHENYGAHDWSGEGDCPQAWKPKGGYMSAEYICKIKNVPNLFESM